MKKLFLILMVITFALTLSGWDFGEEDFSTPSAWDYGTPEEEVPPLDPAPARTTPASPTPAAAQTTPSSHQFHFALGTHIIGIYHTKFSVTTEIPDPFDPSNTIKSTSSVSDTSTTLGFPLTRWDLSAGYNLTPNLWLMAKFHLYMTLANNASGHFLIGPGIRGDIIDNDLLTFFAGGFLSIGNSGKTFVFSPEGFSGVEFKLLEYLALGGKLTFAYELNARKNASIHNIIFGIGAHLAVYF